MKLRYTYLAGVLAAALTSCVSESVAPEQDEQGLGSGTMALTVTQLEPAATRATTTVTNFPVILYNAAGTQVERWETVADVPASYTLPVGNYSVESHTPGTIQKKMLTPYYLGTADMEIQKGVTTNVEVICTMQNSKITIHYDADFLSDFARWSITLDDGSETALAFTEADGTSPAPVYWWFEDEVERLTLQFRATTVDGATVSATRALTKDEDALEQYDDDARYFSGGDAIVINFTPTESTSGHVTGVGLSATVTFAATNETITLEVADKGTLEPGGGDNPQPGGDPEPGGNGDDITLNLPAPVSYPFLGAANVDKSLGDTYIAAEKGLKSIVVKIESTSDEMLSSVGQLNDNYGVDFINGAEIVGNQDVVRLFTELNQPLTVPAEGDKDYTFPIGNFFELLQVLVGEHTFHLTVTDMDGNVKSGTVVITITM